eukprot:FR735291.1.p1 GENE.FR735291.1~~FR735291.1.p1  ORF type:complete len:158 (+),score=7.37 FR735291.1:70-543(+)
MRPQPKQPSPWAVRQPGGASLRSVDCSYIEDMVMHNRTGRSSLSGFVMTPHHKFQNTNASALMIPLISLYPPLAQVEVAVEGGSDLGSFPLVFPDGKVWKFENENVKPRNIVPWLFALGHWKAGTRSLPPLDAGTFEALVSFILFKKRQQLSRRRCD